MQLPTRAIIREMYRKLAEQMSDDNSGPLEIDDTKLGAALAWPRMMATANKSVDVFEVVTSLFTSILSEQPATKGNASLAILLVMTTLRRNSLLLDVSNEDLLKLFQGLAKGEFTEKSLVAYFQQNSIPYDFS